jgi:hypothetical protein
MLAMMKTFNESEFTAVCFFLSEGFMTWGASLGEKTDITKSLYLPDISHVHFEPSLQKIARVSINSFFFFFFSIYFE